ncbi:monocarboxylate transporter 13-like [Acanthaster planci]|uniref:Monocarboxylate transporter 13-like n=1 Tax=Acanthaster planci TaxID=133434 RepID=A0A8B7XQ58_ACAPL|nr:monocarboxylate transporter 13-like [Acanthaster planci]
MTSVTLPPSDGGIRKDLPVDRGRAWFVLVGVHVSHMLSFGFLTSFGILYIEWKEYFQTDATTTSWLISLPLLVASPMSFFVGILSSLVGIRVLAMTGAAVCGIATFVGSFTTGVRQLFVCTAMNGVGSAVVLSLGSIVLSHYFKRRYSLATGVAIVGISIGQMIFPVIIRFLITLYGWRGAMFLIGALQMNGVAACALFRPLKANMDINQPHQETLGNSISMLRRRRESTDDEIEMENSCPDESRLNRWRRCAGFLKVFTNVLAMLNLLTLTFFAMSAMINISHLPARTKEAGWSDDRSAMILLVYAVASAFTRLTYGWFVDRGYIGSFKLQLATQFGAAVATFLNPVSDSFAFLVVNALLLGAFLGITAPLFLVNMRQLVDVSELPSALSLIWATGLFFNGVGTVIAGKIYDATGNYVAPFLTGGAIFLVSFMLLVTMTILKTRGNKRCQHPQTVAG